MAYLDEPARVDTSIKRTADVIAALVAGKASEQGRGGKEQAANQLAVKLLKSGMPEGEVMSEVSRKMGVNLHEMGTSSHLGAIRSAEQQWYDSMQPGEGDPGTTYTFETVNLGPHIQTKMLVESPNFLVAEGEEDGAPPTLKERILGTDWNQVEMDNLAAKGNLPEKGKIVYYPSGEKGIVTFSYDGAVEVTTKRGTIRFSLESDDPGHEFWMKFRDPGTEHAIEMDRLRNQWATENGMTGEELGRTSASIGVGLIPVVGTLQSAVELVSGRDYITGEKVHRGIAAAGLFLGLLPGGKGALKFATKVYQKGGFKLLAKAGPRLMKKLAQVSGPGVLKGVDKLDDAAQSIRKGGPSFGTSSTSDYRKTFFRANPGLEGMVVVHHAVEQQILRRYPALVSKSEIHSLENLRGIPKQLNSRLHLSQIAKDWNRFYRANSNPSRQDLLDFARYVDNKYGHMFNPPVTWE